MSYETDLRSELGQLNQSLSELDSDDFATSLVRKQLERRRDELALELDAVMRRELELSFANEDAPGASTIETGVLGALLTRFQSTINYMRWALESGPAVAGRIPGSIRRSAATETVAFATGSFKVVLRKADLELQGPFEESIRTIFAVSQALRGADSDEDVEARVADIGPEATSRLQKFYKRLANEGLTTKIRWVAEDSPEVVISAQEADLLSVWLSEYEPAIKQETVTGVLKMADSDEKRFALETKAGRRVEGRADMDLAHVEIEAEYRANIVITSYKSRRTDAERERVVLTSLVRRGSADDQDVG